MRFALISLVCAGCGRLGFDAQTVDASISAVDSAADASAACVSSGLVGHWAFDETGGTVAADSIGTNPGALVNMNPATDWGPGRLGNALDFDGANDRVVVPASPTLAGLGPATWTFWMRIRSLDGTVAYKSDNNNGRGWWMEVATGFGGLGFQAVHSSSNFRRYTSAFAINVWSHVAITWDGTMGGGASLIYVDAAVVVADGNTNGGSGMHSDDSLQDLIIGSGGTGASGTFDGALDDFRIYDRVLSAQEIADLHAGCANPVR